MNWLQTVRMAFKSILNNKVRSILTMLGIIIGVASVIAIVSSIQGTSKLQRLQYEAMGVNRIDVFGYGGRSKDWKDFEEYLDTELADKVSAWSPQIQYYDWQSDGVQYRTKKLSNDSDNNNGWTNMYFGNEHYGEVSNLTISAGRDLSKADCDNRAKVCVIGETLRKYFFGAMSPIGQELRIGGKSFEIVGVYKGKFSGKLNTQDQICLLYTSQCCMSAGKGREKRGRKSRCCSLKSFFFTMRSCTAPTNRWRMCLRRGYYAPPRPCIRTGSRFRGKGMFPACIKNTAQSSARWGAALSFPRGMSAAA